MIKRWSKHDQKMIKRWSKEDQKMIKRRSKDDQKMIRSSHVEVLLEWFQAAGGPNEIARRPTRLWSRATHCCWRVARRCWTAGDRFPISREKSLPRLPLNCLSMFVRIISIISYKNLTIFKNLLCFLGALWARYHPLCMAPGRRHVSVWCEFGWPLTQRVAASIKEIWLLIVCGRQLHLANHFLFKVFQSENWFNGTAVSRFLGHYKYSCHISIEMSQDLKCLLTLGRRSWMI